MLKTFLLTSAAILAMSGAAFAADSNVDNVQINLLSPQISVGDIANGTGSGIDASTQAVGTALSVDVSDGGKTANVSNLQVNAATVQLSGSFISNNMKGAGGSISVDTLALGNNFTSDSAGSLGTIGSLQVNALAGQGALSDLTGNDAWDNTGTVTTAAVGNSVDLSGKNIGDNDSTLIQANVFAGQGAVSWLHQEGVVGDVSTLASGNNLSLTATGDAGANVGQVNAVAKQFALTKIDGAGLTYSGPTITTDAVGNSLSVDAGHNVDIAGGQGNLLTKQVAITHMDDTTGYQGLDVSTAALGNTADISGKDVQVGGGYLPLVGDDFVQVNAGTAQAAVTRFDGGVWGNHFVNVAGGTVNVDTDAIGNNLSISGTDSVNADLIQANIGAPQFALTHITGGNLGALTVNTQSIGNAVSVHVGH